VELGLVGLGRTYGSTAAERQRPRSGDDLIPRPHVVTNHGITIDAPPEAVWPWLVQMGWGRGGWYTARWVDRLLFPANGPSADRILPAFQGLGLGDFVPDGAPETECGFVVERMEARRALVLRSTSHLPARWRREHRASLDWSWDFALEPTGDGRRTRFTFRSRWRTGPWWLTLAGWLAIVPADFVMSRQMLRGLKERVERCPGPEAAWSGASVGHGARLVDEGAPHEPPREAAGQGRGPIDLDLP
jgi:hypothetical protein